MKQNVKIFLIALILGIGVALVYQNYAGQNILTLAKSNKATYFYVGTYNNLEEANKVKDNYQNSLIYNDKGIYRVVIGVCLSSDCLDLVGTYFQNQNISYQLKEIDIDSRYLSEAQNYELLIKTSDKSYYPNIINSSLNLLKNYIN